MPSRPFLFPNVNQYGLDKPFNGDVFDRTLTDSDFFKSVYSAFIKSVNSAVNYNVALSFLTIAATFVIIYLVYKCLKDQGLPYINVRNTNHGMAELTPLLPDSFIRNTTIDKFLNEVAHEKPIQFTSQQLEGYTHHRSAKLGAGGFGVVYKGMLPNGLDIAVKVLHQHMDEKITEQQFMSEVRTLWRSNHANLIRLLGYCFDSNGGGMRALVYEYMANNSLDQYLFGRKRTVGSKALLDIATGVARGLRYLHEECQKKIIHYDVKPSNVLLDDQLTPKLTDFGIAQLLSRADGHILQQGPCGTPGYMAPEVTSRTPGPVTEKCDVYSFGVLLIEVVGRRKNMDNSAPESHSQTQTWLPSLAWTMYQQGKLLDLINDWHRHSMVVGDEQWTETAERMCKVAFSCVQKEPNERPTMSEVVSMLEGHLEVPALRKNPHLSSA